MVQALPLNIPHTSFLIYGVIGKTMLMAQLADYIHELSEGKMLTRMYTADKGGFDNIAYQVEAGKLQIHNAVGCKNPMEHLEQCVKGWWLDDKNKWSPPTEATWQHVGARIYEGMLSFTTAMKQEVTDNIESGKIFVDANATSKYDRPPIHFQSGSTKVIGMPAGHYATIYTRFENWINLSESFPGITVWTTQEERVEDVKGNLLAVYPAIQGQKLLDKTPSWFRHTVRIAQAAKKKSTKGTAENQYKVYLKTHSVPDTPSVDYCMKFRLPGNINPADVPKSLLNDPMGVFGKPTPNVFGTIFDLLSGNLPAAASATTTNKETK
jgi:hypothetical protein